MSLAGSFSQPPGQDARVRFTGENTNVLRRDSCSAIITGDFRWRDGALADQAADEGDAAALISAFDRLGPAAFDRVSGGFAAAIIDHDKRKATLAIDRMGICRLVFSALDGTLVFSDNLGDVAAFSETSPEIRQQAILEYLFFHEIPSPGTIYENIRKLGPGEYLEYEGGQVSVRQYWAPRFTEDSANALSFEELFELCRASIGRHIDGPAFSTFLSGGLDSSTVTALASAAVDYPLPAVSIGFDAPGFDEMHYANIVARHFSVDHKQYYVTAADVQ